MTFVMGAMTARHQLVAAISLLLVITGTAVDAQKNQTGSSSLLRWGNQTNPEDGLVIVTRSEWGARKPKRITRLILPLESVHIHHSATPQPDPANNTANARSMRGMQNYHMDTMTWDDIGFHFVIGSDGLVYEGRGWLNMGAHTNGYNMLAYGIGFTGTFNDVLPTAAALATARKLLQYGVVHGYLTEDYVIKGHRQLWKTECPGTMLQNLIQTWPEFKTRVPRHNTAVRVALSRAEVILIGFFFVQARKIFY